MYSLLQALTEHEKETTKQVVGETLLISLPSFFFPTPGVPSRFYNVRPWNRLLDLRDMVVSKIEAIFRAARAFRKIVMTYTPA